MSIDTVDGVAHGWSNDYEATTGNGSLHTEGNGLLISYKTVIAVKYDDVVLIDNDNHSVTTARHINSAISATYKHVIRLPQLVIKKYSNETYFGWYDNVNSRKCDKDKHKENLDYLKKEVETNLLKSKRARVNEDTYIRIANDLISDHNYYIDCFKLRYKKISIDDYDIDSISEKIKQAKIKKKKQAKIAENRKLKEQEKNIKSWLENKIYHLASSNSLPVFLRINKDGDRIQTSRDAEIDIKHASILWKMIQKAKRISKDINENIKLGFFELDKIYKNGDIKVGCHYIKYEQLENIAKQLKYI